jgi:predicted aspartyl protease
MTYASVKIRGPKGQKKELRLLVDTGSLYTWISRDTLRAVGIRPTRKKTFMTIEGRELVREIGEASLEVAGEEATRIVVLGEPSDFEVLGVDALEGLGLEVDPTTKELRRVRTLAAFLSA